MADTGLSATHRRMAASWAFSDAAPLDVQRQVTTLSRHQAPQERRQDNDQLLPLILADRI
jgi:hypothetical protein